MPKINIHTNIGVLLTLLAVIFLAIIEGGSISDVLIGKSAAIIGGEIQQIAFIILTLVILGVSTLHPKRLYLAAYSSMTLGLIVVIASLFDPSKIAPGNVRVIELVLGIILILGGFLVARSSILTRKDKNIVQEGIRHYKK